jgi:threonylcarbamoyladenosine tRNA methylthiotransferase MtaB
MRFSRDLVRLAAGNPVFAPHFHIPLQSGSDRILRRMRRPYSAARFLDLLEYIHALLPASGLGTDILVGFPGETDRDFAETCELVRRSPLTYLHIFPFSAREGTDAYSMPDQISPRVIHERARILREISQEKNFAFRRSFLGREVRAITLAKEEEVGESAVLTENYIHARIAALTQPPNRLINVRIEDVRPEATFGLPAA